MFNLASLLPKILSIPGILLAFTVHEFAHAITAYKLGDDTPKYQGRLTLNPFAHTDPLGFLLILLVGFGWAKPVQTNPTAYKNYRKDDLKVSLAGPLGNLVGALGCAIILSILTNFVNISGDIYGMFIVILYLGLSINVLLCFLNLIPIPGFDGFHILDDLFPSFTAKLPRGIEGYGLIIFIICTLPILPGGASIFTYLVHIPSAYVSDLILSLFKIRGF